MFLFAYGLVSVAYIASRFSVLRANSRPTVETLRPETPVMLNQSDTSATASCEPQGLHWPRGAGNQPARSSTLRCFETAGKLIANGSASCVTEASRQSAEPGWRAWWDRRGLRKWW